MAAAGEGGSQTKGGRGPAPARPPPVAGTTMATWALAPAVPPMEPVRDPLERLARQGRRFSAHPALVHPDHPVQVDPGRPGLAVPPARADGHKIALAVVVLAG